MGLKDLFKGDVKPDLPSHTKGIRQGNAPGGFENEAGHNADGTATARRATGIAPDEREPIDPSMPRLFPA
jgi:hypothetical protein